MTDEQWRFLENEFLTLSIAGALQRSSTYSTEDEKERDKVRGELRSGLCNLAAQYSNEIDPEAHIKNIETLARQVSVSCASLLNGDHLRFGIAQKAVNLYLKYLWCAGRIPSPPHCPFDNNVINVNGRLDLPSGCERRWTQADKPEHYRDWVAAAAKKAKGISLADWELHLWNTAQPSGSAGCLQGHSL